MSSAIYRTLNSIRLLLEGTDAITSRYVNSEISTDLTPSRGLNIFRETFDQVKHRLRKNQSQTSTMKKTRWAVHDASKLEALVTHLKDFVDALQDITSSEEGLLERQQSLLRQEVESISDTQSLRLIRDATSSRHSGKGTQTISDAASHRLSFIIAESVLGDTRTTNHTASTALSFYTASEGSSWNGYAPDMPAEFQPKKFNLAGRLTARQQANRELIWAQPVAGNASQLLAECEKCSISYHKLESASNDSALCSKCAKSFGHDKYNNLESLNLDAVAVPQNQRLMAAISKKNRSHLLKFTTGDLGHGDKLKCIKNFDEGTWVENSAQLVCKADNGNSFARRMFIELRNIRSGKIPFISAMTVGDRLDRILASIEGPPETPYEGGVFWLTGEIRPSDHSGVPLLRFHTKVYHPNIDSRGNLCADYWTRWGSNNKSGWTFGQSSSVWSLGALLVAICGLLSSPDTDDPLVPEIAQKYLEDYDDYCRSAKSYTEKYATGDRPTEDTLVFNEDANFSVPNLSVTISEGSDTNDSHSATIAFDPEFDLSQNRAPSFVESIEDKAPWSSTDEETLSPRARAIKRILDAEPTSYAKVQGWKKPSSTEPTPQSRPSSTAWIDSFGGIDPFDNSADWSISSDDTGFEPSKVKRNFRKFKNKLGKLEDKWWHFRRRNGLTYS
jgi:ubiquitin-protein ligase